MAGADALSFSHTPTYFSSAWLDPLSGAGGAPMILVLSLLGTNTRSVVAPAPDIHTYMLAGSASRLFVHVELLVVVHDDVAGRPS